jgi:hypothetical protein
MRLHSCIRRPLLLVPMEYRRSSCGRRLGDGIHGQGVDDNIGDGDALLKGHKYVTSSLRANGGADGISVFTGSKARESAEGWLKGGSGSLCTAQRNKSIRMSWLSINYAASAELCMPWSVCVWCRATPQPHCMAGALMGRMARSRTCRRTV